MRLLFTLTTVLFLNVAMAADSLSWQKITLEEKIQRKYGNILSSVLAEKQYLVDVEVSVTDPGQPNFDNGNNEGGVKVSDLTMPESNGDYIAFSKMGLEVPVLDKIFDDNKNNLMNLYRYNESFDLFKNLEGIKVNVFFSDKVPEKIREIAENLVRTTRFTVAEIKPTFSFETMEMEWAPEPEATTADAETPVKPEEVEPKIWAKDWYEWASRFGNAVGLIIFSIIMAVVAIILFKQWKAFMENYAKMMAPPSAKKDEDKEDKERKNLNENINNPTPLDSQEDDVAIQQGYERFQQCLQQHPDEAITVIRSWLIENSDETILALRGVAQQASPEEMNQLLNGLSEEQRNKWKSLLTVHLETQDIKQANKIIFQEVVKSLLVPSKIRDGELLNLVMELDPRAIGQFFDQNKDQIGILLNLLGPSIISKTLSYADDKKVELWLSEGAKFNEADLDARMPALKNALMKFKKENSPSPFLPRLLAMLQNATPATEDSIFKAIGNASGKNHLIDAAMSIFPSQLVLNLSDSIIKEVITSLPMAKRVELIFSREEDLRERLIDIIAEPGTPARDLIDMEIQSIESDSARQDAIMSRQDEIWFDFVKLVRTSISKNYAYKKAAADIIEKWATGMTKGLKSIPGGKAA